MQAGMPQTVACEVFSLVRLQNLLTHCRSVQQQGRSSNIQLQRALQNRPGGLGMLSIGARHECCHSLN